MRRSNVHIPPEIMALRNKIIQKKTDTIHNGITTIQASANQNVDIINSKIQCNNPATSLTDYMVQGDYVSVSLSGGIGNRIFQILAALGYSEKFKKKCVISRNEICNGVKSYERNLDKIISKIFPDVIFVDNLQNFTVINQRTEITYTPLMNCLTNVLLNGHFQDENYFPSNQRIPSIKTSHYPNTYFIHIRAGDYLESPAFNHNLSVYYKNCINILNPDVKYIVFSDDNEYAKNYMTNFNVDYILSDKTGQLEVLVEMANCEGAICANSSFSWMGAFFQDKSIGKRFMPSVWMNGINCIGIYPRWATIIKVYRSSDPEVNRPSNPEVNRNSEHGVNISSDPEVNRPSEDLLNRFLESVLNRFSERLLNRPSEPVVNRPSEPLLTRPSEPVLSIPSEPVLTRPSRPVINRFSETVIKRFSEYVLNRPAVPVINRSSTPVINRSSTPVINRSSTPVINTSSESSEITHSVSVILSGGIGNRIFQMFAGLAYARKHGKKFVLCKSLYQPPDKLHESNTDPIIEFIFPNIEYVSSFTGYSVAQERAHMDYHELQYYSGNVLLKGYFQVEQYSLELENITNIRTDYYENTYFIHIRLGDYIGFCGMDFDLSNYHRRCINILGPNAKYIIFSNENDKAEKYIKQFNIDYTISDKTDALETLIEMANCAGGICANSTFSWMGAFFQRQPRKNIFVPAKWVPFAIVTGIFPSWARRIDV